MQPAVLLAIGILLGGIAWLTYCVYRLRLANWEERRQSAENGKRLHELQALAQRNSAILHNAMDGFFVLDQNYRFREVNRAFCQMIGYSANELLQMRMTDLEVAQPVSLNTPNHWRTGLNHFTTAHRHRDGRVVQLESCAVVVRDGDTKLLASFVRDVTERLRSQQAVRSSEAQYRSLVQASRDLIWSLDNEGRWTFVNHAAREIYGVSPEEMRGRSVMDFVRPELRPRMQQMLDEVLSGRELRRFEAEHMHRDGRPIYLSINAIPLRNEHGVGVGCTGTATDLTYRREAEANLQAAHDRFQSLVQGMPIGYIVWSSAFRVLEWNPAAEAIFGYTAEEAIGRSADELIVLASGRQAFSTMGERMLRGEPVSCVLENRRRDGTSLRCEWHSTVLRVGRNSGPPTGNGERLVATLVLDVSERERLEEQLRQAQRLEGLGVLAGGVAHDFNNLLVGILGNASLALEQLPPHSSLRPLVEKVVNAGRRATNLTQRMLAYAGRATTDVQIMDLNAMVREMAEFAVSGVHKNVRLELSLPENLPPILADSGQVQQVIMNLVINAAEAIGEAGGEVAITTWSEHVTAARTAAEFASHKLTPGPFVILEVRDTGCGMTPEILNRIFDPFFTTKFTGRGLGLSSILGIVRAHHGAITVESTPGLGTTFRVLFPATAVKPVPAGPAETAPPLPRGSTVLVIDDEEEIREVVEAVLESRGIRVMTAENGAAGLRVFQAHPDEIDLVLLDMNMPGMGGEAVLEELRRIRPRVRVVLSTGYNEQETTLRFGNAHLAGFVSKPYTASALVDKIATALASN